MKPSKDELWSLVKLFGFSLLLVVFLIITISLGKGDSNLVIEAIPKTLIPYPGPLISPSPGTLPPYPWPPVYPTLAPGFHDTEMAISYATQTAWYFESIKTPTVGMEENKAYPGWHKYVQGPLCFYDPIADFSLWLEPGWIGESYPEGGVIYIRNFNPEEIQYDHGTALTYPKMQHLLGFGIIIPENPLQPSN